MRRLIIVRKDLNLKPGKLAAMVGHLCEAFWTNMIKKQISPWKKENELGQQLCYTCNLELPIDMVDEYLFGIFTKTICEAKNLKDLKKVEQYIEDINNNCLMEYPVNSNTEKVELGNIPSGTSFDVQPTLKRKLVKGVDYDYIRDNCLTDIKPEDPDGRTTIGVWFKPLPDEIAHKISKKYKLYRERSKIKTYVIVCNRVWDEGEDCTTYDRYNSLDEAKKHLNYLFKKFSEDNDHADVKWKDSGDSFTAKYKLFKYRNVETYEIIEEDIEVKDKFDEPKED